MSETRAESRGIPALQESGPIQVHTALYPANYFHNDVCRRTHQVVRPPPSLTPGDHGIFATTSKQSFCNGTALGFNRFTPRTDHRFPRHDLDVKADLFPILHDLAHIAGGDLFSLHDLQNHMFPGLDLYHADPAPPLNGT